MSGKTRFVIPLLSLVVAWSLNGQVVFSRRVYKEQGRSYQQIWTWNPANGTLKALTQSPRNHYLPACTNGKITFVSPEPYEEDSKLWSFDSASGEERIIGPAPMPASHETPPKNDCPRFAKAGGLEACSNDEDLSVSRAGKVVGHFNIQTNECPIDNHGTIGKCDTPILYLGWSADGKWLLVGELGLHTNSTAPQSDYYVVEAATMKLTKVASATQDDILWLPRRDELLYVTPRDLTPLPGTRTERTVWVQHLMLFDPATGKTTAITSGVSNNLDASSCGR
jgi:hypothetical protein